MFKLIALFVCIYAIQAEVDYAKLQAALDSLGADKLPESFKELVNAKGGDDHYCCKIDMPVVALDQTRIVSYNIIKSESYRCGSSSCGFLGWSSCTKWCMRYWIETAYHTEVYTVYQQQQCPDNMIMCCTNYLFVLGHCMLISDIANNVDLLHQLLQEGIVIPGITGK